jgi:hypothetical protein
MSTGLPAFDGESGGGGGLNWLPTFMSEGPGMDALAMYLGGQSFLLSNLPRLNDNGALQSAGFLSGLGFKTIPAGEGSNASKPPTSMASIPNSGLGFVTIPAGEGFNNFHVVETVKLALQLLETVVQQNRIPNK